MTREGRQVEDRLEVDSTRVLRDLTRVMDRFRTGNERTPSLSLKIDELVRAGQVESYSALASLGQVSRARISQIANLLSLAPDIQEALLFLPPTQRGRDPIILADLMPIAAALDWRKQRRLWRQLLPT